MHGRFLFVGDFGEELFNIIPYWSMLACHFTLLNLLLLFLTMVDVPHDSIVFIIGNSFIADSFQSIFTQMKQTEMYFCNEYTRKKHDIG